MNKVTEFIMRNNNQKMLKFLKQNDCKHIWIKHGPGYLCTKCDYSTSKENDSLNKLIKQQLEESI